MSKAFWSLQTADFVQDWTDTSQIVMNDRWDNVPSIVGYLGDTEPTSSVANVVPVTDTRADLGAIDVIANQTDPDTLANGGVAEFELADPTIALQGSSSADDPSIVLYLDATNRSHLHLDLDLRDIDGSTDNAVQPINVQYRIGDTGTWTNLSGGLVSDAANGPSDASLVTHLSLELPREVDNQGQVELRVLTSNAAGADEWIGIDALRVSSQVLDATPPTFSSLSPANGSTGVAVTAPIVLTFSEDVMAGTGAIVLTGDEGDTRVFDITNAAQAIISGATVTLIPSTDLDPAATYTVSIASGALLDLEGNPYSSDPQTSLGFTTGVDGVIVPGTAVAETLTGGAAHDFLEGDPGNDLLIGGALGDHLDGGAGVDTAQYAGFAPDYALRTQTAVAGGPEGGTDRLVSVENLSFLDGTLSFDGQSTAAQIVRLYDSFLGRAPDAAGFNTYLNFVAAGHSFQDMADNAAASPEFHDATASLDDTQYVTYVYEHSLHREPDPDGLQQYLDALHDGSLTRTSLIVQAAESPEHVALTAAVVAQGLWIPNEQVEGLELLYDAAVGRQPDPTGLNGYGALLSSGTTFRQVANQMADSAEFKAAHANQTDSQYIDSLYLAEVGRHADTAGLNAYLDELAHGRTRGDVLYETAMSQEHQSHVLAYYDPLLPGI